jgi:hypothetical protein
MPLPRCLTQASDMFSMGATSGTSSNRSKSTARLGRPRPLTY